MKFFKSDSSLLSNAAPSKNWFKFLHVYVYEITFSMWNPLNETEISVIYNFISKLMWL